MTDMIEKMARAIAEEFSAGRMKGRVLIDTDSCRRISYLQEEVFAAFAKAALSALEDPSAAMVQAGGSVITNSEMIADPEGAERVFVRMIQAAKAEAET